MSGTVLVYGGSREDRRHVQRALVTAGYRVLLASSMAEAAKCLSGDDVRAILIAGAAPGATARAGTGAATAATTNTSLPDSRREIERSTWLERGIPVIDVVNRDGSELTSAIAIALLDVLRNTPPRPTSTMP